MKFRVFYLEKDKIKSKDVEAADMETCKKAFNQWRVKTNPNIWITYIETLFV